MESLQVYEPRRHNRHLDLLKYTCFHSFKAPREVEDRPASVHYANNSGGAFESQCNDKQLECNNVTECNIRCFLVKKK